MAEVFAIGFLDNLKVLFVAILIYAIIYALLKKLEILGNDPKVNSLIALLSAIIVSFTGVAAYSISYAVNWFVIIFFILFLLMLILLFLGVEMKDITKQVTTGKNMKAILIAFAILFAIIFVKSFFALNNAYDTNNPQEDKYAIDASFNTGVNDITGENIDRGFFYNFFYSIDKDLLASVLFLIMVGVFIIIMGK